MQQLGVMMATMRLLRRLLWQLLLAGWLTWHGGRLFLPDGARRLLPHGLLTHPEDTHIAELRPPPLAHISNDICRLTLCLTLCVTLCVTLCLTTLAA